MSGTPKESFLQSNRKSVSNFFKGINILNTEQRLTINDKLYKYKEIKQISEKTGLSPVILLAIMCVLFLLILFGFYEDHLTIVIGTIYPLYFSMKTLKKSNLAEIKRWLTYWIFFTFFIWFETVFYYFLTYIPFYFLLRSVMLVLCYLPQYQYSTVIYDYCIKTLFHKYHLSIREMAKALTDRLYGLDGQRKSVSEFFNSGIFKSLSTRAFGNNMDLDTLKQLKDLASSANQQSSKDPQHLDISDEEDDQGYGNIIINSEDEDEQKQQQNEAGNDDSQSKTKNNNDKKPKKTPTKDPYFKKNSVVKPKTTTSKDNTEIKNSLSKKELTSALNKSISKDSFSRNAKTTLSRTNTNSQTLKKDKK